MNEIPGDLNPMPSETPRFSIIIPTCRGPAVLQKCLKAVFAMDGASDGVEVIVVNDGGASPSPVPGARGRNIQIVNQERRGAAAARNAGAQMARGRFLAFLDDDCLPSKQWLGIMARHVFQDPPAALGGDMVNGCSECRYAAATQIMMDYFYRTRNRPGKPARFLASSNLVVPRAPFLAMGGFDEGFPGAGGEDRDFCDRWLNRGHGLIRIKDARVVHCHDLRMGRFLSQHFGYGKGAFRYYRKGGVLSADKKRPAGFFLGLLKTPLLQTRNPGKYGLVLCLLLSQAATGFGFIREWAKEITARF